MSQLTMDGIECDRLDRRAPWLCLLLVAVFWAACAPWTTTLALYHPDERHFSVGAIRMLDSGDYLSPQRADGELRLLKPVLGYWLAAASFKVGGITPFTSRLPFLILGGLVIAAAYDLARSAGARSRVALLAASIMTGNFVLVMTATRSIAESVVALFLTVAASGAAAIFRKEKPRTGDYARLYLGVALAISIKGLLGVVFIAFVFVFATVRAMASGQRGQVDRSPRKFVHVPFMIAALVIGGWWYVVMQVVHHDELARQFLGDQVSKKVNFSLGMLLRHAGQILLYYPLLLLPWLLILWNVWVPRDRPAADNAERSFRSFALAWAGVCWCIFSFGIDPSIRYVLPAMPPLAVVLAMNLARIDGSVREKLSRVMLAVLVAVITLAGALAVLLHAQMDSTIVALLVTGAYILVIGSLIAVLRRRRAMTATLAIGPAFALVFSLCLLSVRPVILPGSTSLLYDQVMLESDTPARPVEFIGRPGHANRLHILFQGQRRVEDIEHRPEPRLDAESIIVWELEANGPLPGWSGPLREFEGEPIKFDAMGLLKAALKGEAQAWLKDVPRRRYVITRWKTREPQDVTSSPSAPRP